MPPSGQPSIVLDLAAGQLRIDDEPVDLRPKTWDVLCALAERAGQLVTKAELLDRVWPGTAVSEGILNKSVGELRATFDDSRDEPRFIETVPRRGYRWIGDARIVARHAVPVADAAPLEPEPVSASIIARDDEIARFDAAFTRARSGRRQCLFVSGEAGAGKTTVVDHFLDRLPRDDDVFVVHGQCLETSGPHEPYLPLLDGFERLARDSVAGSIVTAALRRCAPAWIAQMPTLDQAREMSVAAAPGSMLRELVTLVDEIARDQTLVVVLEDAHWADLATTDALAALARRRDSARLLVVVTKRDAEAIAARHSIMDVSRDLVSRGAAERISLVPFAAGDLGAYIAHRCPGLETREEISLWLLQQTAGNPLFVRLVLDEWVARGLVAPDDHGAWIPTGDPEEMRQTVPDSLRALLGRQIARLAPEERTVLEAASVRIGGFHASQVAAAAGMEPEDVEVIFENVTRRGQLLRPSGEATGEHGRLVEQYAFLHAAIQSIVAADLPSARRRRLHLAAAEQLERTHAGRTQSVAAFLAVHYEAAGDAGRAIPNLREAARQAMLRDAPRDAIVTLEGAIELIDASPHLASAESERVLVMVYLTHARQLAYGFVDSKVADMWVQTSELAAAIEDARERLLAESGRIVVSCVSGRYKDAEEVIRSTIPLLEQVEDAGARKTFFFAAGCTRYRIAAIADSCAMFETALSMDHVTDPVPGADLTALLMSQYAPAVALAGRPEEVRRLTEESMARSRVHSQYSECVTGTLVSWALALNGDYEAATPIAARCYELAEANNFRTWSTRPLFVMGMSEILAGRYEEGEAKVRAGMEGRRGDGQWVDHSAMCCLFAEALMEAGRPGAAALLDEAADFVATSGELYAESEIWRLRARALRNTGGDEAEVERMLRHAFELAQLRGIRWHAMLAAADLADLLETRDAAITLAAACDAIAGGARLAAMQRAREILARPTVAACA